MSKFLPVFAVLLLSGGAASAQVPAAPAAPSAAPALLSAPVAPAGDVIETLRASGQFTTFLRAADLVGLTAFVKARPDITVVAHRDRWLMRAPDATSLANAIADTERPANAKLRIEVDPPRL